MNILRVVWDWPPPWSGLAPGPYELTVAQQHIGNTVTVFTGGWPRRAKEAPRGVRVLRLPSGLIPGLNVSVFFTTAPFALIAYVVFRIFHRVDVLHVHGHLSLIFSMYKKLFGWLDTTPYVVHFHHVSAERAEKIYTEQGGRVSFTTRLEWWLHQYSDRLAVAVADRLMFVSRSMQDGFAHYYVDEKDKDTFLRRAVLLGNGVNTQVFGPDGEKAQLPWKDKKVLLFVGNLVQRKNPDVLIRALAQLGEEYAVIFIGTGDQQERLQVLAQDLGVVDRVLFAGYIPNHQLPTYFRASDVFVLPSKDEGFPKVVLEALACGVPVVASGFDPGEELRGEIKIMQEAATDQVVQRVVQVVNSGTVVDVQMIRERYSWEARARELQEAIKIMRDEKEKSKNIE